MPVASLEPEFLDLMTQDVQFAPWTGQNGYGERTYGTLRVYPAHVTQDPTVVTTLSGETIRAQSIAWVSPTTRDGLHFIYDDLIAAQAGFASGAPPLGDILEGGQFIFPDQTKPPIRTAAIVQDDIGWHHIKFLF